MKKINLLIGIPGSGKSTYLKGNIGKKDMIISYDSIRKKLYGDEAIQGEFNQIYIVMVQQLKEALADSKIEQIFIDNTNVTKKARKIFFGLPFVKKQLNNKTLEINAIELLTPFEECLKRNNNRERIVPEKVLKRMKSSYQEPLLAEGFNKIEKIKSFEKKLSNKFVKNLKLYLTGELCFLSKILKADSYLSKMIGFEQKSKYHQETLDEHLHLIGKEIKGNVSSKEDLKILLLLNIFHDIGKLIARQKREERFFMRGFYKGVNGNYYNKKDEKVVIENAEDYQFINHENISEKIFKDEYLDELILNGIIRETEKKLYLNIIKYHLLFHKHENKDKEFNLLPSNIKRLGYLFSKFDNLGRISLVK